MNPPTFLGYPIVCNLFETCIDHHICRAYRHSLLHPLNPAYNGPIALTNERRESLRASLRANRVRQGLPRDRANV
jgi:hypothetical protein